MPNKWLKNGWAEIETMGFIIAAQGKAIKTNSYGRKILKDGIDTTFSVCGQFQETVDLIVAGFPEVARSEYIHRHHKAATYLTWNISKEFNNRMKE